MNRAERRAAGFRGPAFLHTIADGRPRYVRRNSVVALQAALSGKPITRRNRKRLARVDRHASRLGLYPENYVGR